MNLGVFGLLEKAVAPFGVPFSTTLVSSVLPEGKSVQVSPEDILLALKMAGFEAVSRPLLPEVPGTPVFTWYGKEGLLLRDAEGAWWGLEGSVLAPRGLPLNVVALEGLVESHVLGGGADFGWFWGAFRNIRGALAGMALLGLLIQLAGVMVPFFSMAVYDRVLPTGALQTLWLLALGMALLLGLDIVLRLMKSTLLARQLALVGHGQDAALLALLLRQKSGLSDSQRQADLLRLARDVREQLVMYIFPALADFPLVLLFFGVIACIAPSLLAVPVGMMLVVLAVQLWLLPSVTKAASRANDAGQGRFLLLADILRTGVAVRLFNRQPEALARWGARSELLQQAEAVGAFWNHIGQHVTMASAQATYVMVLVLGARQVVEGNVTVGALVAVSMLCSRAMMPALQVVDVLGRIQKVRAGLRQLREGLGLPLEELHPSPKMPQVLVQCRGSLEFRQVGVCMAQAEARPLLRDVTFSMAPGERWGLVGPNGAGKSTLLGMAAGLVSPTSGSLLLDNVAVSRFAEAEWRRHVLLLTQFPLFADVSLRETIAGAAQVDTVRLAQALEISGLGGALADMGLGTEFRPGPQAEKLSGGQRQMLALASAIYRNPKVLLLDEPTSAFDPEAEKAFVKRFKKWLDESDVTLLLVTHRVTMLELVSHMAVLHQGQLVFRGKKGEVMARLKGEVAHG